MNFFKFISVVILLVLYLVIEVLATMFLYMYLALHQVDTFGHLIAFSRDVLNIFTNELEQFFPEFANQAYTTLLGELGPKSILLLLIGLIVSVFGRFILWAARQAVPRISRIRRAAA